MGDSKSTQYQSPEDMAEMERKINSFLKGEVYNPEQYKQEQTSRYLAGLNTEEKAKKTATMNTAEQRRLANANEGRKMVDDEENRRRFLIGA